MTECKERKEKINKLKKGRKNGKIETRRNEEKRLKKDKNISEKN